MEVVLMDNSAKMEEDQIANWVKMEVVLMDNSAKMA